MCGIAGIHNFNNRQVRINDLADMAEKILHRGPDSGGYTLLSPNPTACTFIPESRSLPQPTGDRSTGFAHRRLSIIDLSDNGIQPMSNASGTVWITYNGEIFNYLEIRIELESAGRTFHTETDTEVLLQAYEEWGIECQDKFNGMWAFAIWDTRLKRLFISRDRFGIKPLYYSCRDGQFAFASEPKALLKLDWVSPEPDMRAVADYLVHSREDCFEWTFFKSIKRLEPGHFLDIGFHDTSISAQHKWWNLSDTIQDLPIADDQEYAEHFLDLFTSSVKLRLRSDVPVGTCLSGGLDSSAVVCVARPWLEEGNQKTYSAVYDESFKEDETRYIDEITRFAKIDNFRVHPTADKLLADIDDLIRIQDEPFGSTSQYAQYKVFQLARSNGTTVTLDGQGADEELAGYHYMYPVRFAGLLKSLKPVSALREFNAYRGNTGAGIVPTTLSTLAGFLSHRSMIRWANLYDPSRRTNWVSRDIAQLAKTIETPALPYQKEWLNGRLYELFTQSSLPALLRYEDRNSMASSVEARLPFLDHRLVSYIFSLPDSQKIHDGWTKYVFRQSIKGLVPESVRTRKDKIGFATPEAEWYRTSMAPYLRDILNSGTAKKRGIYNTERLNNLIDANVSGKINAGRAIWRAVNLELWFRAYID